MPTYEYKCLACGHPFEKFQSIKADPIKTCPACGKDEVKRLMGTGATLIFKGSGFYTTDYRSESYKEKAKAESGASSGSKSGESSGSPSEGSSSGGNGESKLAAQADGPAPAKTESKPAASSPNTPSNPKPSKSDS